MTEIIKESIFECIDNHIKRNGTLPKDFNLDSYIANPEEKDLALGALDGLSYFHTKIEPNEKTVRFLKNLIKDLDLSNVQIKAQKLEKYFSKNNLEKALNNIDGLLKYVDNHRNKIDVNALYKFAANIMILSSNIEAVKVAISLFSLINIEEDKKIKEVIQKFAVCDEFTLFCTFVLKKLQNSNEILFRLAKKTSGWGKIYIVSNLKPETEIIREWLLTDGCYNDISNSYLALSVAKNIDLPTILIKNKFNVEEFIGLNEIMEGLLDEENLKGISYYPNYNFIFDRYLELFNKMANLMYFYDIPIKIYSYLLKKNSMEDLIIKKEIIDIFENRKTYLILKEAIHSGFNEDFKLAIEVLNFDSRIKLQNDVMEEFSKKPMDYYFCLEYFFHNNKYKKQAISLLRKAVNLEEKYSDPKALIDPNNKYTYNLTHIIQVLKYYPFECEDFVIAGLKSESMHARISAINTIMEWLMISKLEVKDLDVKLQEALKDLQKKEVIKDYKIKLNHILNIKENLDDYIDPEIIYIPSKQKINLYIDDDGLDNYFDQIIISRGKDYYSNHMVLSCVKNENEYIGFVQGSEFTTEYQVKVKLGQDELIEEIECSCPFEGHCKHEYAVILYLRDKFNKSLDI